MEIQHTNVYNRLINTRLETIFKSSKIDSILKLLF